MKTLLFLPLLVMGYLLTGCTEKNEYVTPNQTIFFTIQPGDWQLTSDSTYLVDLPIDELNNDVNTNFGIVVSISGDDGVSYLAIPEVFGGFTYFYSHTQGSLTIETQAVDGQSTGGAPTTPILAKVVLVESQQ